MNKERRKELSKAIGHLEKAKGEIESAKEIIETCKDEEQESYDALPEGVQDSERGEIMSDNVDGLDEAFSVIEDWPDDIDEAIRSVQEAIDR